jgi:hypothetical protein
MGHGWYDKKTYVRLLQAGRKAKKQGKRGIKKEPVCCEGCGKETTNFWGICDDCGGLEMFHEIFK